MPELAPFTDLVAKAGVIPLLLIGLVVLGREYRRMERRCDRWQRLALDALQDADRSAAVGEFFSQELKA